MYSVIIFKRTGIWHLPKGNLVIFKDHSDEVSSSTIHMGNHTKPIALPNLDYVEIHAAIAGILHTSGARRFFDEVLGKDVIFFITPYLCNIYLSIQITLRVILEIHS